MMMNKELLERIKVALIQSKAEKRLTKNEVYPDCYWNEIQDDEITKIDSILEELG